MAADPERAQVVAAAPLPDPGQASGATNVPASSRE